MRAFVIIIVVIFASAAAFAQAPAAAAPVAAASRTMMPAAEVDALIAKAKADRKDNQPLIAQSMMRLGPSNVSLEYRPGIAVAAVHETEAELFYVVDGAATLVTGGRLTNESRTNAANLTGNGIEGGVARRVAKGDFVIVPERTPHWFSAIDNTLVVMSLHLPRPAEASQP